MIPAWVAWALGAWLAIAVATSLILGRAIRTADEREVQS